MFGPGGAIVLISTWSREDSCSCNRSPASALAAVLIRSKLRRRDSPSRNRTPESVTSSAPEINRISSRGVNSSSFASPRSVTGRPYIRRIFNRGAPRRILASSSSSMFCASSLMDSIGNGVVLPLLARPPCNWTNRIVACCQRPFYRQRPSGRGAILYANTGHRMLTLEQLLRPASTGGAMVSYPVLNKEEGFIDHRQHDMLLASPRRSG
jgi:hypothetical protein